MLNRKSFALWMIVTVTLMCAQTALSQIQTSRETKLANIRAEGAGVRWEPAIANAGITMTVIGPDGIAVRREFEAGASPSFSFGEKGSAMAEGQYTYELVFAPVLSKSVKDRLAAARKDGTDAAVVQELRRAGQLPSQSLVQSGSFSVQNGVLYIGSEVEPTNQRSPLTQNFQKSMLQRVSSRRPLVQSNQSINHYEAFRRSALARMAHSRSFTSAPDQVIPDDLIVQGSICAGLDCVNGEVFGFDTIRLKENNDRLQFDDTSTGAGFATNNWQIRANSSASGGESFLGFVDQGAAGNSETGTIVFQVTAGAPANSLRVASNGKVGFRTATPVLDLHVNTSDTPAFRMEQNNSGGFTAQTWDVAGNEANFFVRDVTGGSRLPFRIRPGAPTSSIDIAASGNVGIGTQSPAALLDVSAGINTGTIFLSGGSGGGGNVGQITFNRIGSGELGRVEVQRTGTNDQGFMAFFTKTAAIAAAERMRIDQIGRVGIGTAAPDQLLSVNGDASKAGGGAWQVFSDQRLKSIKGNFTSGLKAVMQLQPLRYEYKPNNALGIKSEGEHVGFAAQAVQKVVPEAVTRNSQGYLMVNNDPIIWTMLNAIKEQQLEIAQLKQEVRQLRATARKGSARARR